MITDWNIQSRAHACQICAKGFRDGQAYHTVLWDRPPCFERQDLCEACWQERSASVAGDPNILSHWQGVYVAPPPAPPEPIKKETAETLLRRLRVRQDPRYEAACYILAVMLERKRLLRVKSQLHENGARTFVYEQPKT